MKKLFTRLSDIEWMTAYRKKNIYDDILNFNKKKFKVIKNNFRYWYADPFIVEENHKTYIFFEAFDRIRRKGVIGYRQVKENKLGKVNIIIKEDYHLSYPYIYIDKGSWYIIPESKQSNQIVRYKAIEFPNKWIKEKVCIDNILAVDNTPYFHDDYNIKMFTYLNGDSFNNGTLKVLNVKKDGFDIIYSKKDLEGTKRPAGKILKRGNEFYRPSQLCINSYGEGIIFNKLLELSDKSFKEIEYKKISIQDINLDKRIGIIGVHTYNYSDNWEVIDVKIRKINIISILSRTYYYIKRKIFKQ